MADGGVETREQCRRRLLEQGLRGDENEDGDVDPENGDGGNPGHGDGDGGDPGDGDGGPGRSS